ncbi:hypothetical protein YYG_04322 [Plasmodium vinckei petteri]|uniref:Methyltransferase, putative n=1 Tax=Plasmodium vinckei petteri TaxID=138298 RepID=W7AGG7_PLAVN|nr:hypothetical protein YYG_04322 [Plasmodium vinckei petteri]CAD2112011.1 methyltransferase, putative [Plasmodium vinckei petteri]
MNFIKTCLSSYPVKYYGKTYKVTNTLKLNGIGLKSANEEEIKNFLSKFDLNCMVYLIENEDIIYLEFHRKKECSYLFNFLNNNSRNCTTPFKFDIKAEYSNIKYDIKKDCSNIYSATYEKLLQKSDDIFIYNDVLDPNMSNDIIQNYENDKWSKYTKNDEINISHYFYRGTPNKIYKTYCVQDASSFFPSEFLTKIKKLLGDKEPNQYTILKCHIKKSIEYIVESSYIFEDEIAFLVLENDLPMSFLDIKNESKTNLMIKKNTLIKIKGKLRYELIYGIPKKKSIQLDDQIVERETSYLIIFRFINKNNIEGMLAHKTRKEIIKDPKQESSCIPINVNEYSPEHLEKEYVMDVYNQIAQHFCYTRYKPWNNVENIINQEKVGNIIMDAGCGNGKNLKASSKYCFIGFDFSLYLLKTAKKRPNTDIFLANCINIPIKSNIADLCISIAVIHHLGTHESRRKAVSEMVRCTKIGGKVLIYVWAYEQKENVVGNRKFDSQDIFVPWYLQQQHLAETNADGVLDDKIAYTPTKKNLLKFQRYYHVFRKEELYDLCTSIDGVQVEDFFFDNNNWAILLKKKS